jgi:hypothetical protein
MKIAKNTKRIMIVFLRKRRMQMYHKKKGMRHGGRQHAMGGGMKRRQAMYGGKETMRHGGAAHGSQPSYGNTVDTAMPRGSAN